MRERLLWGVLFTGADPRDAPMLLSEAWCPARRELPTLPGVPTRALLFCTRAQARDWCAAKQQEWHARRDFVRRWRVKPVRVRETVEVVLLAAR